MFPGLAARRRLRLPWTRQERPGVGGDAPDPGGFDGGELVAASVYDALEVIATAADTTVRTETDSLVAGGDDHGPYTWARQTGPLVLDSEEAWDDMLGAGHDDLRPALVYVDGDVTVSHDPARRRPFVALHVTGALDLQSDINGLGANHSASGSDKPSRRILWRVGTYGGVTDPEVPAVGGDGGAPTNSHGGAGAAGVGGALGGGGAGGGNAGAGGVAGSGAAGSSYSGGPGGGGIIGVGEAGDGGERGGPGGSAATDTGTNRGAGGGAGNPGGAGASTGTGVGAAGESRTGGVWYIVAGSIAGAGSIVCDGGDGGEGSSRGGGASGGGHGTVQTDDTNAWGGGVTANGGEGGEGTNADGGNGGLGTARVLPATEDS